MNKYQEMKERHQKGFNGFPMFFAFNNEQFDEGMRSLGLEPNDISAICHIGAGGYIRKTDKESFKSLLNGFDKEHRKAIAADTTGEGYIYDMFLYELANHEYCITYDDTDTLEACGLNIQDILDNKALANGLYLAKEKYLANCNEW